MSSESNVFVEPEAEPEPELESIAEDDPTPEKPKSRRKKAPMDEETKERLLKQLAKGRETASKNRKIKAVEKEAKEERKKENGGGKWNRRRGRRNQ